ncbi:branched-chain amino acid ABC transporter permease [Frigidibacter sp. SD6-1]|uniref:branched-chain amino acid ABC transporter permease n=1 Tax=Frigidibacter sp. SD6-1 TaxID=3032581 RepID=UPI0024DFCD17|nr:branched-chain amino acid ABC transporter permease [Frigidibacter sp. SD6-1]
MTELLNSIIQGILIGGLYALFAAGLSLVFGIMRIVNLAHGDLIVAGSFLMYSAASVLGLPIWVAALLVLPVMALLGYGLQRSLINHTIGTNVLPPLLVTFGISIILQNGLLQLFTADNRKLDFGAIEVMSLKAGPISVGWYAILVFAVSVATIWGLQVLSFHTRLGRVLRATTDDPEVARVMGVRTEHVFGIAMAIALVICGIAGVLLSAWTSFTPLSGPSRLLIAFEVVVIGGLGSIWGTLIGGVVLGVAQALGGYFDPAWQTLAGHISFIAILALRPQGIMGGRRQ